MPRYTVHLEYTDDARERIRDALKLTGARNVRISEDKSGTSPGQQRPDNVPTCPIALEVAKLFGRKPEQEWSETEISIFKTARKRRAISIESMTIMTAYYRAERKKGTDPQTGGIHRRDLLTWLRNVDGENDRALAHSQQKTSRRGEWLPSHVQPPLLVALPSPANESAPTREEIEAEKAKIAL